MQEKKKNTLRRFGFLILEKKTKQNKTQELAFRWRIVSMRLFHTVFMFSLLCPKKSESFQRSRVRIHYVSHRDDCAPLLRGALYTEITPKWARRPLLISVFPSLGKYDDVNCN